MTENEIINYLKENKNKGIAFGFLSEEVRAWVYIMPISLFRVFDGEEWIKSEKPVIRDNDIICLPDNCELKKLEKSGEWVEFEIDEGGDFGYLAESEKDERYKSSYYSWYSWQKFLEDSRINERGFTHFGGYYYGIEPIPRWYMTECVAPTDCNGSIYSSYTDGDKNIKPLTPKKIRFWKESK